MCLVTASVAALTSGRSAAFADALDPHRDITDTYLAGLSDPLTDEEISRISVRDRPHHAFEPIGLNSGPIFFYPELTGGFRYDSNVYARPTDVKSDAAFVLSPKLTVISNTPPFSYKAEVGADIYRFRRLHGEDRTDSYANLQTRAEVAHDLIVKVSAEAARRHEERRDSISPQTAATPVPYTDVNAQASITKQFNRFGGEVGTTARKLNYTNVQTFEGTTLDLSSQDGRIFTTYVKPTYQISPDYQVYVRGRLNDRKYSGIGDLNHDSNGYDVRGGLSFALTSLFLGSIEAGYLSQKFDNPLIPRVNGPAFTADVKWLMTPLTTIAFNADRRISETAAVGQEARVDTVFGAEIDHELLRNLILFAGVKHVDEEFPGTPRNDEVVKVSAGFDYFANPLARFGLRYDFINRNSNLPTFGFDEHVVTLNVTAQY